ncbi:MAG: tetratricopeptide repeat protein [Proteobacteria bacterium]|nr:tetratricopeptide repeat protein [Pseudomonadota bacterium]
MPAGVAALAVLLAACAATPSTNPQEPAAAGQPSKAGAEAAEAALKRGDCREASEAYARLAAKGDAATARRATQVAVACEHLPAAWQSATRWRTLAPDDREANALYAAVALKLYRTADARGAIADFWRVEGQKNAAPAQTRSPGTAASPPAAPAPAPLAPTKAAARTARSMAELSALLVEESEASAVLIAMSGVLEPAANSPETFTLLGELALSAYDGERAAGYAHKALGYDPKDLAALRVLARAYVMRGDGSRALATARLAKSNDPRVGGLALAEVLASLDRSEEAHQELERLRGSGTSQVEIDRRLALLAFNSGDYKEARQRFNDLLSTGDGNDAIQLYLADIAAREGDTDTALAGYRRLYDSSVAVTARSRAAALLLERNSRVEALALLDDYAADHPEDELDITLVKAHLLADNGDGDGGLALLSSALERHPQHPSIEYDRAVILEQSGHVRESVEALRHILEKRPEDPTLLNALGYTMADHSLELTNAEALIRRALTVMPDNPAALDSLGWVRFRSGDLTSASSTLERAYSLGHDGEIAAHWGEVLWASGRQSEARQVWAAALARDPESKPLKATIKRLLPDAK